MRYSQIFARTSKSVPADAETANAKLLIQGGFVRQEMAGVYSWLPLGLKVLRKVERIVREEMDALGAQEILMPALEPKENWITTGRLEKVDILFRVPSQTGKEYILGASHEEVVTPLVASFVHSYKDLPVAVYQLQTKFRDELRAKSGVLRGREFGMKDMYSFHANQESLTEFYHRAVAAYVRVYERCGVPAKVVEASGGIFTKNISHEFQILTPAGEDRLLACPSCSFGQNSEIVALEEGNPCPNCGATLAWTKGVEAGNTFDLGTQYTEAFKFEINTEDGTRQPVYMGCYGIGLTRLVGSIVEALHDERGIMWPKAVAPAAVHLVSLFGRNEESKEQVMTASQELYENLRDQGVEILWDEREASPGEKLADADLLGLPLRLVISEKTLAEESVEWKLRSSTESHLVKMEDAAEEVGVFVAA
jgi:prolyl-tRNA synthetase